MKELYDEVSFVCSRKVTQKYSTSFSLGVKMLHPTLRNPIYSLYGFVRFADEIVDSFHSFDKKKLISEFERDYYKALKEGISMNPILNSFQKVVKKYNIDDELIQAFLTSMKWDLDKKEFNEEEFKKYIYGSADVVGLMCLKIFVNGDEKSYKKLEPYAMHLGSAFQKVNFLRDLKNDTNNLDRVYFPILKEQELNRETKKAIIEDIDEDFRQALIGIKMLPHTARTGVYTAFLYYRALTWKIKRTPASRIMNSRIRISNTRKAVLLFNSYIACKLNLL